MSQRGIWTRIVHARRAVGLARVGLGGLAALLLLAFGAVTASAATPALTDMSGGAYQILAPGEEGTLGATKYGIDQGKLYDRLTPLRGNITQARVEKDYLSEKFGVTGKVLRTEKPKAGLEIVRDTHDIPHIYGENRADVMFGSGWAAAEDRGLLLQLGLGPAYTAALDVPGVNPFGLLLSARSFTPSKESTEWVENQKASLEEKGATGEQVIHDLENWAEGVNAYEQTLPPSSRLKTVTLADAIAGNAFIGSIFGNGGGGEISNSELLGRLQEKYSEEESMKIYQDLREANDPEAPTTAKTAAPYDTEPAPGTSTPGTVQIEPGTLSLTASKALAATKASRRKMSNFLVVAGSRTASGHPLAVMGPQLGYFHPEIVFQADLHGGGIDAQGIVAPISPYVFIGRGRDYAWSLTSSSSQNTMHVRVQALQPERAGQPRNAGILRIQGRMHPDEDPRRGLHRRIRNRTGTRGLLQRNGLRACRRDRPRERRTVRDLKGPLDPRPRGHGRARVRRPGL